MTHEMCLVHVRKSTLDPLKGRVSLFGYLSVQFVHFRVKRVVIDTRTSWENIYRKKIREEHTNYGTMII